MKATLRIATKEQYCFIEPTVEGTPEEIVEAYYAVTKAYWEKHRELNKKKTKREIDEITSQPPF